MHGYSKDLIESFALEIIANAHKIIKDAKKVSSHDFSSGASLRYINIISKSAQATSYATKTIYKKIDFQDKKTVESNFRILKRLKESIKFFSTNLKYISDSKMSKIPWGLSNPLAQLANNIIDDANILLYQQWDYNYSIVTRDINEYISDKLELLQIYIPSKLYKELKIELKRPLYLISFPYLEKNNILQYSLLGHEVGHLYADKILHSLNMKTIIMNDKNLSTLLNNAKSKPQALEQIEDIWKRIFQELISDTIGTLFFGPAMLFSILEFSLQQDIDIPPNHKNGFYPPWRARLRVSHTMVLKLLPNFSSYGQGATLFSDANIIKRVKEIESIVAQNIDKESMQNEHEGIFHIFNNAYNYLQTLYDAMLLEFDKNNFDEIKFFEHVNKLTQRLEQGIPPNIIDELDITTNATLCEILNAAWKYRISWENTIFDDDGNFNEEYLLKRKKLNQLTNKAIEYCDLTDSYLSHTRSQS